MTSNSEYTTNPLMAAAAEADSNITPIKPHFFKPLLPGFLHGLLIPVAFLTNYLNHHGKSKNRDTSMAVLRTVLGEWEVKIEDGRFEENGWRDFADHHSLHVGDMVVFRHEGDLVFDVTAFDSTACERFYDHHHQPQLLDVKQEISLPKSTDNDPQACGVVGKKKKVVHNNSAKASPKVAAASSPSQAYPCFTSTLRPSNLKENRFFIPMGFAKSNGLCDRRCEMLLIIDDRDQKSWQVRVNHKSSGVYISGDGYRDFVAENGLRAGDNISFELISEGTNPVMVFHAPRPTSHRSKRAMPTYPEVKEAVKQPSYALKHLEVKNEQMKLQPSRYSSYFISTVTTASISNSALYIPRRFGQVHGLNKYRKMFIKDPEGRLWPVQLRCWESEKRLRITRGWKAVALANGLKHGQAIKLEIVKASGKTLVMNFCVYGESKAGRSSSLFKGE